MSTLPHFVGQLAMAKSLIAMADVHVNWVIGRRMLEKSVAVHDMNGDVVWCSIELPFLFDQVE